MRFSRVQNCEGEQQSSLLTLIDYLFYKDRSSWKFTPLEIAKHAKLYGMLGTVHSAIHFCRLTSVSRAVLVGFDGTKGYAKKLGVADGGWNHEKIRAHSIEMLKALDLAYLTI